ncbi:MAG: LysM peptidoglycan-binding domain-containing protein [Patescibacteria group bacterium]
MEGFQSILTIRRLGLVILAIIVFNFIPVRVFAMQGYGVSVFPAPTQEYSGLRSWFVYEAEPGTEIKDKVIVKNHSNSTVTLKIAVLDGAVTNDGGYTLVRGVEENKDLGTWATLSRDSVTLPPQTQQIIDLTVKVPDNADVGSHPGGVVIWEDTTVADGTGAAQKRTGQLQVVTRVAARLYLTVPGDIVRKLDVENVRHTIPKGVLYFQMTMHNQGNVTLMPETDITLRGIFGKIGTQPASQFGMILRGGTTNARVPWQKKAPKIGRFVADFRIHYGEKDFQGEYVKDEYQDVRYVFWIIPWMTIFWWLIGLALLLLVRQFWLWIIIRQRLNTKTKKHTVKRGETLSSIAQFHGINAKKIAKFNVLRWPYDLQVGDVLLIPYGKLSKEERKAQSSEEREALLRHSGGFAERLQNLFRRRSKLQARHSGEPMGRLQNRMNKSIRSWTSLRPLRVSDPEGQDDNKSRIVARVGLEPVIIEAGDTIKDVAEFAGVTPKEIIRINRLHWPYKLKADRELLIPIKIIAGKSQSIKSKKRPVAKKYSKGKTSKKQPSK